MGNCPHCGKPPYPVFEKQPDGTKKFKKENWKNLFKMSKGSLLLFIIVMVLVVGYIADTKQCRELLEHPCDYAEKFNCNQTPQLDQQYSLDLEEIETSPDNKTVS